MKKPREPILTLSFTRLTSRRWSDRTRLVAGVCALLLLTVSPLFSQPVGQPRSGPTDGSDGLPPFNCDTAADWLRDQYRELGKKIRDNTAHQAGLGEEEYHKRWDEYLRQGEDVRKRFDALRATMCPDIGDLIDPDTTSAAWRRQEEKDYRRKRDLADAVYPDPAGNGIIDFAAGFGIGAAEAGAKGIAEYIGNVITAGLFSTEEASATQVLLDMAIEGAAHGTKDVVIVGTGDVILEQMGGGESDDNLKATGAPMTAAEYSRKEAAYLKAYILSNQRFQDALASQNAKAMAQHSQDAVKFALAAKNESRKAALSRYELERSFQQTRDGALASMAKKGVRWQDNLIDYQKTQPSQRVSKERVGLRF